MYLEDDGLYGLYEDATGEIYLAKWSKENSQWGREVLCSMDDSLAEWTDVLLMDINASGTIVGRGTYDEVASSFVITVGEAEPIPEPMSIVLVCSALIGIIGKRGYRKS